MEASTLEPSKGLLSNDSHYTRTASLAAGGQSVSNSCSSLSAIDEIAIQSCGEYYGLINLY